MQRRATIWILDAFQTLPSFGIEAITGLIPVHLHLQKLSGRSQLKAYSLSHNYILRLVLELNPSVSNTSHLLSLDVLTPKQRSMIKGLIVNIYNRFNEVSPSFDLFNREFSLDSCLIDIFHSHFYFTVLTNNVIKASNLIFISSTISQISLCQISLMLLLYPILASRIIQPHLSLSCRCSQQTYYQNDPSCG